MLTAQAIYQSLKENPQRSSADIVFFVNFCKQHNDYYFLEKAIHEDLYYPYLNFETRYDILKKSIYQAPLFKILIDSLTTKLSQQDNYLDKFYFIKYLSIFNITDKIKDVLDTDFYQNYNLSVQQRKNKKEFLHELIKIYSPECVTLQSKELITLFVDHGFFDQQMLLSKSNNLNFFMLLVKKNEAQFAHELSLKFNLPVFSQIYPTQPQDNFSYEHIEQAQKFFIQHERKQLSELMAQNSVDNKTSPLKSSSKTRKI